MYFQCLRCCIFQLNLYKKNANFTYLNLFFRPTINLVKCDDRCITVWTFIYTVWLKSIHFSLKMDRQNFFWRDGQLLNPEPYSYSPNVTQIVKIQTSQSFTDWSKFLKTDLKPIDQCQDSWKMISGQNFKVNN